MEAGTGKRRPPRRPLAARANPQPLILGTERSWYHVFSMRSARRRAQGVAGGTPIKAPRTRTPHLLRGASSRHKLSSSDSSPRLTAPLALQADGPSIVVPSARFLAASHSRNAAT
jgi:hypothetical protein